jgi:tetratricopeptide (TPR) repeat protein
MRGVLALIVVLLVVAAGVVVASRRTQQAGREVYYMNVAPARRVVLEKLFELLARPGKKADEDFSLVREIANQYGMLGDNQRIINFLSEWVERHPRDPYNSYYLLRVADCYLAMDAPTVAALYLNEIVHTCPDLIVREKSIHLACLRLLTRLASNPDTRAWYYQQLIARFPKEIDLGYAYFMLGQVAEKRGAWEDAIDAYDHFIPFYGAIIPGFPGAYSYAKQMVDFYNEEKNYSTPATKFARTFSTLDAALRTVKGLLASGDLTGLWQYRARANFFARPWSQMNRDDERATQFSDATFVAAQTTIHYDARLSPGSGANDAYLRTWGWARLNAVWYFCFHKIYFPLDPELHGRWEWAGIYYGERF